MPTRVYYGSTSQHSAKQAVIPNSTPNLVSFNDNTLRHNHNIWFYNDNTAGETEQLFQMVKSLAGENDIVLHFEFSNEYDDTRAYSLNYIGHRTHGGFFTILKDGLIEWAPNYKIIKFNGFCVGNPAYGNNLLTFETWKLVPNEEDNVFKIGTMLWFTEIQDTVGTSWVKNTQYLTESTLNNTYFCVTAASEFLDKEYLYKPANHIESFTVVWGSNDKAHRGIV